MSDAALVYTYQSVSGTGFQEQQVEVKDGLRLRVRPILPEDEPLLQEAFSRMSERTVYFRFFSPLKRLPHEMAMRLARVDYQDRFALVATSDRPQEGEQIVGVARYDRAPGTDTAEVAVAVVDEYQRRGVGATLLGLLAQVAREHGIRRFSLIVLPENQTMLSLLRRLGWIHQARFQHGMYEIEFDV
jgi:RimJ/RimL family protein N-acetyltransferase